MFNLGTFEILIIITLGLVLLGPKKLPEVARSLGKFISRAREVKDDFLDEMESGFDENKKNDPTPPKKTDIKKINLPYEDESD